jgi:hypothetical protein
VRRVVFGGRKDDTLIMDNACQHLVHAGLIRVSEMKLYKKEQRPVAYEANPLIWATKDAARNLLRECVCTSRHIGIIGITLMPMISEAKSTAYIPIGISA